MLKSNPNIIIKDNILIIPNNTNKLKILFINETDTIILIYSIC